MKVTFYIPSRTTEGKYIYATQKDFTEMLAGELAVKFGGATVTESMGYWIDDKKRLVREKIMLVYSFVDEDTLGNRAFFQTWADHLKRAMKQQSILYTISNDEQPYFI
jgi:uncharacterized protein YcgL (UPF0745 family)